MLGTDLKYLYKALTITLSFSQKRLLNAICLEPTAHLYSKEYMSRHQLTRGGIRSGIRRLSYISLVGLEDGEWRLQPPQLRIWANALHIYGPEAAESLRWAVVQPEWVRNLEERGLKRDSGLPEGNREGK
jgi:hypothetical protein